jgi:hypothetical protein
MGAEMERDAQQIADISAPTRYCKACGQDKPWTEDYFGRRFGKRKDGSKTLGAWYTECRHCRGQKILAWSKAKDQERRALKAGKLPDPPVAKALGTLALPKPQAPSFRTVLQTKAERKWPMIAQRMVDSAAAGDKNMIRLVAAYILGTPREATEDNGPTEFWHALLASAGQRDPGATPDLGTEESDLEPDSGAEC